MTQTMKDAYHLMHRGALALSEIEENGMKIDVPRLDRTIEEFELRVKDLTKELQRGEEWKLWKRRFGERSSIGSRYQLGVVLKQLGHELGGETVKKKQPKMDEEQLSKLDDLFVDSFLKLEKDKKFLSTYLKGIRREVIDGFLHPVFNLHLALTYRSSSDSPNFQNIPIRDKEAGRLIRSCFVPRPDHTLVEIDYGGHEFKVAACFWRDDAMVAYASDPKLDIHRDMAAECYCLPPDEVPGNVRFFAKNQFLFPTLYGSWYRNTSHNLWNAIGSGGLTTKDGCPLEDHLLEKEITRSGYEGHIRQVEQNFNERFPQWSERKDKWWDDYQKRGWFDLMTGFRVSGLYSRNQVYNTPVQGPAFHCLLWSLTRLVKEIRKRKMRTKVIGQIHDSIEADVPKEEVEDYVELARGIMTRDLAKAWPWVIVPLSVDVETSETNWHEKAKQVA